MEDQFFLEYLKITGNSGPKEYIDPEQQGQSIKKCSILKETTLEYSTSTSSLKHSS